jgi:hypothetical protein
VIRLVLVTLVVLVTAGFGSCGGGVRKDRAAVDAHCDSICFTPCVDAKGDTGVRWEGDPQDPGAFDALGGDVVPQLTEKLRTCEVRRRSCAVCLERLQREGVIR